MMTGRRGANTRIRRSVSMPPMPGMFTSSSTQSKLSVRRHLQRLFAPRDLGDIEAQGFERRAQGPANGWFIVDYQNADDRQVMKCSFREPG